jgi:LysM repeat protein/ABC-type branched-subunit amino acid transport system substrate-binding protein
MMMFGAANTNIAGAQEYVAPPVTISKDKVKLDGKAFYSHIVLEKQTLYSISKAYNISIDEIYKYNPSVKENGLRKNDIIIIPVVPATTADYKPEKATPKPIVQREPEPQTQIKAEIEQKPAIQGETTYTVSWYDDLRSIAEKFNVSEESIIAANNLKTRKLKNRQVLVIPAKTQEETVAEETYSEQPQAIETVEEEENESWDYFAEAQSITDLISSDTDQPEVVMSLVMPFKANGKSGSKNNLDFYSGVLLAARDLTDKGINIKLKIFDSANDSIKIDTKDLKNSDVIIGPVSTKEISMIQSLTAEACPIVSPLDQRVESLASKNRYIIQAPTSQQAQFADLVNWIKEDRQDDDKVIIISEKGARQSDNGKAIISVVNSQGVEYIPFSYSILEGRNIQGVLESKMTTTGTNRIIIASESEAFVNDAVRNLNLIYHNKFKVVLYAPSKIRTFETIEIENLHNISLHTSLSYDIDYQSAETRSFIGKYRAMFGTEPSQFAFQGYDLATYFAEIIAEYQENWTSHLEEVKAEMLQSTISFWSNGTGGYVNQGTRRIIYGKEYSVTAARTSHSQQPEE